ncbi:MAG TPA: hypothetical protein VMB18_10535 [Terriglobales bacterium]|nr:hypothetical protein [Terriglobales bacterium]
MTTNLDRLRRGVSLLLLLLGVGIFPVSRILAADTLKSAPCSAPEYKQFDFWVGDWNAYDVDNPTSVVGHARVDRILNGCVLREDYQGNDGHEGQSFTIYDASRKVWHQTWVTNNGRLLTIEGQFEDGQMVLSGTDQTEEASSGTFAARGKQRKTAFVRQPSLP